MDDGRDSIKQIGYRCFCLNRQGLFHEIHRRKLDSRQFSNFLLNFCRTIWAVQTFENEDMLHIILLDNCVVVQTLNFNGKKKGGQPFRCSNPLSMISFTWSSARE